MSVLSLGELAGPRVGRNVGAPRGGGGLEQGRLSGPRLERLASLEKKRLGLKEVLAAG